MLWIISIFIFRKINKISICIYLIQSYLSQLSSDGSQLQKLGTKIVQHDYNSQDFYQRLPSETQTIGIQLHGQTLTFHFNHQQCTAKLFSSLHVVWLYPCTIATLAKQNRIKMGNDYVGSEWDYVLDSLLIQIETGRLGDFEYKDEFSTMAIILEHASDLLKYTNWLHISFEFPYIVLLLTCVLVAFDIVRICAIGCRWEGRKQKTDRLNYRKNIAVPETEHFNSVNLMSLLHIILRPF